MRILLGAALLFATAASCADTTTSPAPVPADAALSAAGAGNLVITEIMIAPQAVSHWDGEWFEVTNLTSSSIDLQGWTIASNGTTTTM
jgi:Spy/CpxP family protein refolding chaperone